MGTTSNRDVTVTATDLGRIRGVFPSFTFDTVLHVTGKCKLLSGNVEGKPAIAKLLANTDRQWVDRFRHEIQFYRMVEHESAPVSIPKMYAADERELLIVEERVEGSPLASARYLDSEIDQRACERLLRSIKAMGGWSPWPPLSRHDALSSFQSMLAKGVTAGFVTPKNREAVLRMVNDLDWTPDFSHGDLLPGNCILAPDGRTLTLVDWEYADYRLPGYDLALIFMVSLRSDGMRNAVRETVNGGDTARRLLFLANLAALLTREVRILQRALHVEGFPERQIEMRNLLELTWEALRSAEHDPARFEIPFEDAC